jgi:hypothetical protein
MPKYKITQSIETYKEWSIDTCCEIDAERQALETEADTTITEQIDFTITEMTSPEQGTAPNEKDGST